MRRESSRQVLLALERLQSANVGSAVVSFDRDFDKVQVDGLTLGAVEPSRQWLPAIVGSVR